MNNDLKITPVPSYSTPKYPTKEAVRIDPAILNSLPRRWTAKPAVCMALMLTISTGLYGCAKDNREKDESEEEPAISVPFFEHGEGRGSYGCIIVAPAVYLSEEEGIRIIREEAEASGVFFNETKSIKGRDFPATNYYDYYEDFSETWKGTLELDGYDPNLKIGFEYVSRSDFEAWEKSTEFGGSVITFNTKGTAARLSEVLENTAVFYDPGQDNIAFDMDWQYDKEKEYDYRMEQTVRMREDLRKQVRDFLEWLAAEGII